MFDYFQLSEKTPEFIQFCNIIDKCLTRESSHNLSILTDISSKLWALLMSRFDNFKYIVFFTSNGRKLDHCVESN